MEVDLPVPPTFDRHNLRSVFYCSNCKAYLGHRPITTRCGQSICRKCALEGHCPIDACRQYSWNDCPYDIKLGDLLADIEKVIHAAVEEGLWKDKGETDSLFDDPDERTPLPPLAPMVDACTQSSPVRYLPFDSSKSSLSSAIASNINDEDKFTSSQETTTSANEDFLSNLTTPSSVDTWLGLSQSEVPTAYPNTFAGSPPLLDHVSDKDLSKLVAAQILDGFQCDICCHCFLEPMTLRCGHTYCRECLHRSIEEKSFMADSGNYRIQKPACPLCRQTMGFLLPLGQAMHHDHTWNWLPNQTLQKLISICWLSQLDESKKYNAQMSNLVPEGMDIPLFVCTTSLPTQPTRLQIFEPKYRTMMRKILRSPDKVFGMTSHDKNNPSRPFATIGVTVQVESVQYFHPGSINTPGPPSDDVVMLVDTRGIDRFEIKDSKQYHAYWTAKIALLSDSPTWESDLRLGISQEDIDATNRRLFSLGHDSEKLTFKWLVEALSRDAEAVSLLSLDKIIFLLHEIINIRKRVLSKSIWDKIVESHGKPTYDAAELSWWFPGVFIGNSKARMALLRMTNPMERLQHILTTVGNAMI